MQDEDLFRWDFILPELSTTSKTIAYQTMEEQCDEHKVLLQSHQTHTSKCIIQEFLPRFQSGVDRVRNYMRKVLEDS